MKNKNYKPCDLNQVKTYSLTSRSTKVNLDEFASICSHEANLSQFLDSLPHILKANDLRYIIHAVVNAVRKERPVIVGMGGHVVKCGLAPLLIHMMEKGIITGIAMNGGASIHDFEIAFVGRTSEDVGASLETGMFGMVRETPLAMNSAIVAGVKTQMGLGASLGHYLQVEGAQFRNFSILASGYRLNIPVTVHVAVGGDTIHMHPSANGAALGEASFTDFRILASVLTDMHDGGVYLNIGSAVMLPEVFLKALNIARNLSETKIENFVTVNMDMLQHYRPLQNVVQRPTQSSGAGYTLTGHHEIMVPLLFNLILAELSNGESIVRKNH